MAEVMSVVGWDSFQHYKDRDPPWIKLYRDLLTTESWVLGTDLSRLVQVASLLLAARYKNQIPLHHALVRRVANLDCNEKSFLEAVDHLVRTNFLQINTVTSDGKVSVQVASTALDQRQSREETEQSRAEREKRAVARPTKRCPENFVITPEMRTWAAEKVPGVNLDRETEAMRDWEFAKARSDWPATWRQWMRKASETNGSGKTTPRKTRYEEIMEGLTGAQAE